MDKENVYLPLGTNHDLRVNSESYVYGKSKSSFSKTTKSACKVLFNNFPYFIVIVSLIQVSENLHVICLILQQMLTLVSIRGIES